MNENRKGSMPIADTNPPRILVLGSTGRTGGAVATQIEAGHHDVVVVRAARDQATVDQWRDQGLAAARLDLDDARTFPAALDGIDRLFVMTGYTVAMTHQTKMITDAAADAGVGHLVHLGIFGDGRSTEPHFAWHELVERYIEGSGIAWTHLHPHMFMENLLTTFPLRNWRFTWPAGDKPCGLFWFTISRREQRESAQSGAAAGPRLLTSAEFILKRIWAASNEQFHSLTDE